MNARRVYTSAERKALQEEVIRMQTQYRVAVIRKMLWVAMLAAAVCFGIGKKRMERFKKMYMELLAEGVDCYMEDFDIAVKQRLEQRGIDTFVDLQGWEKEPS